MVFACDEVGSSVGMVIQYCCVPVAWLCSEVIACEKVGSSIGLISPHYCVIMA